MKTKKLPPLSKLTRPFLLRFFADPKKRFCKHVQANGRQRCATGFLYEEFNGSPWRYTPELGAAINTAFGVHDITDVFEINNGQSSKFKQRSARARILAALIAAGKKRQQPA